MEVMNNNSRFFNMKLKTFALFLVFVVLVVSACRADNINYGSFTSERTESYDRKYFADQTVSDSSVTVTVYDHETKNEVFSFAPARSRDFWGICWESDSYNIWVQSGDIGVVCYQYDNGTWILNEEAQRPAEIVSKYDS